MSLMYLHKNERLFCIEAYGLALSDLLRKRRRPDAKFGHVSAELCAMPCVGVGRLQSSRITRGWSQPHRGVVPPRPLLFFVGFHGFL